MTHEEASRKPSSEETMTTPVTTTQGVQDNVVLTQQTEDTEET